MKTIIAPIDFSPVAENAAIFAGNLAEFYGADLWLYHTYEITIPLSEYSYPFVSGPEMQAAAEFELEEYKKRVQAKLKRSINIKVKAENASLSEGLLEFCDETKPDLVVMGLSGKNALTRLIVGSNTIKAVHNLNYPVLVVPPKAEFIPVRKIGFACDYKKITETTSTEPIKKIVNDFGAELHVLNVIHHNEVSGANVIEEGRLISEKLKDLHPEYHSIASEDIATGINWFAEKEKLDWIVVIPKKHNLVDKLFIRSSTKDLIYHSSTPVLCIHE